MLYVAPGIEAELLPLKQGGTGTRSDEDIQPKSMPDRYESGNLNVAGIVGLEAGVTHLLQSQSMAVSPSLVERLLEGLHQVRGITLYGPRTVSKRVAVFSLNLPGYDPQELAALLDAKWSIQTRAGIHCAPRMHQSLGTSPAGTLRLSLGHFTTAAEVDAAISSLGDVAAG
jgi:selenocysteine lyase/cysteine desulfurase